MTFTEKKREIACRNVSLSMARTHVPLVSAVDSCVVLALVLVPLKLVSLTWLKKRIDGIA